MFLGPVWGKPGYMEIGTVVDQVVEMELLSSLIRPRLPICRHDIVEVTW